MAKAPPTPAARFLKDLRAELGLNQEQLAHKLDYARGTVSNIEAGREPSGPFVARLNEIFDERSDLIEAAFPGKQDLPESTANAARTVARLITSGAPQEMVDSCVALLLDGLSTADQVAILTYIGERYRSAKEPDLYTAACRRALDIALKGDLDDDHLIPAFVHLLVAHDGNDQTGEAWQIIDWGLSRIPCAGSLWLYAGVLHARAGALQNSFAALTTAMHHGGDLAAVSRLRAMTLMSWCSFDAAIKDFDIALKSNTIDDRALEMRAYRAFCVGQQGDYEHAIATLEAIRPHVEHSFSAEYHFLLGHTYLKSQQWQAATDAFLWSLNHDPYETRRSAIAIALQTLNDITQGTKSERIEESEGILHSLGYLVPLSLANCV